MERENPRTYISGVRTFLAIFFKYKRMILTVFLVVAIIGITIALQIPAMYEAKANLLVKFGREFMYRPESARKAASMTVMGREEAMNNEIKILTNQDLMKKVVGVLGVENLYPKLIDGQISPRDHRDGCRGARFRKEFQCYHFQGVECNRSVLQT